MTWTNHHNGLKTAVLLGGMWSLLLLLGYALTRGTGSSIWLFILPIIGVAQTAYAFWNSDKIAVRSMGAIEVTEAQQPQMYAIVRELSAAAGQPMPRLYVAPTMSPNAFATGRSPSHAAVCCTQGILQLLNERELRGVLGHELSHVYNRDILTSSVAAGIASLNLTDDPAFYQRLSEHTTALADGLLDRARAHGIPLVVNHLCGMLGLFFSSEERIDNLEAVKRSDTARFARFSIPISGTKFRSFRTASPPTTKPNSIFSPLTPLPRH